MGGSIPADQAGRLLVYASDALAKAQAGRDPRPALLELLCSELDAASACVIVVDTRTSDPSIVEQVSHGDRCTLSQSTLAAMLRASPGAVVRSDIDLMPVRTPQFVASMRPCRDRDAVRVILGERAWNARPFGARHATLLKLVHSTLSWVVQWAPLADMPSVELLTVRERETLEGLLAGETGSQIAQRLGLSIHTVQQHIKNLYRKLGVSRRVDLVRRYASRSA